ncbi:MAG: hypothetical protein KGJ90_04990 [Patescibacteria group bacterium]|nr:hypothetical protein [Patescibacteria group bacterium]
MKNSAIIKSVLNDCHSLSILEKEGRYWLQLVDNIAGKEWLLYCHDKARAITLFGNGDYQRIKGIMEKMGVRPEVITQNEKEKSQCK